jgi:hypothetical protein
MEALAGGARTEYGYPDGDGHRSSRSGAERDEAAGHWGSAPASLRLNACSQSGGRLDLDRGALRERNRTLLLGEPVGKLRGRRDSRLECGATLGCERPVRERGQLGRLLTVAFVSSTTSDRHLNTKGNSERMPTASPRATADPPEQH